MCDDHDSLREAWELADTRTMEQVSANSRKLDRLETRVERIEVLGDRIVDVLEGEQIENHLTGEVARDKGLVDRVNELYDASLNGGRGIRTRFSTGQMVAIMVALAPAFVAGMFAVIETLLHAVID